MVQKSPNFHSPRSVPINKLIRISGTPLANVGELDPFDFVRTIATARVLMPKAYIRLSAGREQMSDELQVSVDDGNRLCESPKFRPFAFWPGQIRFSTEKNY